MSQAQYAISPDIIQRHKLLDTSLTYSDPGTYKASGLELGHWHWNLNLGLSGFALVLIAAVIYFAYQVGFLVLKKLSNTGLVRRLNLHLNFKHSGRTRRYSRPETETPAETSTKTKTTPKTETRFSNVSHGSSSYYDEEASLDSVVGSFDGSSDHIDSDLRTPELSYSSPELGSPETSDLGSGVIIPRSLTPTSSSASANVGANVMRLKPMGLAHHAKHGTNMAVFGLRESVMS